LEFIGYIYEKSTNFLRWLEQYCFNINKNLESRQILEGFHYVDTKNFNYNNGGKIAINVRENKQNQIKPDTSLQSQKENNIVLSLTNTFATWFAIEGELSDTQYSNFFSNIISAIHKKWPESRPLPRSTKFIILSLDRLSIIKWLKNYFDSMSHKYYWNAPDLGGSGNMYISDTAISLDGIKSYFQLNDITKNPVLTFINIGISETENNKLLIEFNYPELLEDFVTSLMVNLPKLYEPIIIQNGDSKRTLPQNLQKTKNKPGRPHYGDDIWAWEQVNRDGRPQREVYDEWSQKINEDKDRKNNVDLERHFKRIVKPDWYKPPD